MKPKVRRLYRSLEVTPASVSAMAGARVRLMCERCGVPRDLDLKAPSLWHHWTADWETIFARVSFKCRCGSYANALRITRPTRDSSETLLSVVRRGEYHG